MTFPKLSGFIHFSKTFPGLENAVLKFHDISRFFMTVRTLIDICTLFVNGSSYSKCAKNEVLFLHFNQIGSPKTVF